LSQIRPERKADTAALFADFPVCGIFAGYPKDIPGCGSLWTGRTGSTGVATTKKPPMAARTWRGQRSCQNLLGS